MSVAFISEYDAKNFHQPAIVCITVIFLISMALILIFQRIVPQGSINATIASNGEIYAKIRLNKTTSDTITVTSPSGGSNTIVIEDGQIRISHATCPDKLCIHQGARGLGCSNPTPIVCLPNKLSISVEEDK